MAYSPSKRPRPVPTINGRTPRQICEEKGFDPLLEMIALCKAKVTVRDKNGVPLKDADGKIEQRPLLEPRLQVEAVKALIPYVYPQLRCQEVKEQLDVKFEVTIRSFKKQAEPIEAIDVTPKELAEN